MLTNPTIASAFDLSREDPRAARPLRPAPLGPELPAGPAAGRGGVGVITIDALAPKPGQTLYFSWDDHINAQPGWDMAKAMRWRAPFMDQALSALIEDVYARGLDREVLIVALRRVRPDAAADASADG